MIEFVGGALLLLGLFTRPVAFLLSGTMAVAYWMFHAPSSLYPLLNGGDAAILYCFVFLLFVFTGPGALSLDRALRSARAGPGLKGREAVSSNREEGVSALLAAPGAHSPRPGSPSPSPSSTACAPGPRAGSGPCGSRPNWRCPPGFLGHDAAAAVAAFRGPCRSPNRPS